MAIYYESRDIRDKTVHPATFPISLPNKIINLFTHEGELVLALLLEAVLTLISARDIRGTQ